jgi:hypothetical protein
MTIYQALSHESCALVHLALLYKYLLPYSQVAYTKNMNTFCSFTYEIMVNVLS